MSRKLRLFRSRYSVCGTVKPKKLWKRKTTVLILISPMNMKHEVCTAQTQFKSRFYNLLVKLFAILYHQINIA